MDNTDRIKYYSFNIESTKDGTDINKTLDINEGLDNETKADYQSSEYNSIKYSDSILFFGDEYYSNIELLKDKYLEMLNKFTGNEFTGISEIVDKIYNKMNENIGNDKNERSAVLEYVDYGRYDKSLINKFIDKVNNSEYISGKDIQIQNIE